MLAGPMVLTPTVYSGTITEKMAEAMGHCLAPTHLFLNYEPMLGESKCVTCDAPRPIPALRSN